MAARDQINALRTQAQAAFDRGDYGSVATLKAQADQIRAQSSAQPAPAAPAATPAPQAAPATAAPAARVRSSGVPAFTPQTPTETNLFNQAIARRSAGDVAGYHHNLRLLSGFVAARTQGTGVGRAEAFGGGVLGPIADAIGAVIDTTFSDHSHGESTDFGTNLQERESARSAVAAVHPVSAGVGVAAGLIASAPLAGALLPARAAQAANVARVVPTVGRLTATAAIQGAGMGAGSGAEHASEQRQSLPDAAMTVAGEATVGAAENAAAAFVLGHVGRAAFGGLRAFIGNFAPTQRGFAALARTDAARSLGLTPANLLAASNRFRAAAGREPSPMEIMQAAGEQAQNPLAARTVGQLLGRSPNSNAMLAHAAQADAPTTTQTSNALFAHLDNVNVDANTNQPLNAFFARPNVQRVIRMIRSSDPEMGARLDAASDGTAPLAGRDADFLRRTLMKGGTGPSGIRFGSVQLANDLTGIVDSASGGQYSRALAQHGANKGVLETAAQSLRRVASPSAATPAAEASQMAEGVGHTVAAAVVGHGPAMAFRLARATMKGVSGISNRQADAVSRYLVAQGPDAVTAFSRALQNARGTAQAVAIVRDVLARSALGLAHGAARGDEGGDTADAATLAPAEAAAATPPVAPTATGSTTITPSNVPQDYIDAITRHESGGRADAANPNSSAVGAHQFIESTWLRTIQQHGNEIGMSRVAAQINPDGSVSDPAMRASILALRTDPAVSERVLRAFTSANSSYLAGKLGRPATNSELHAAHVLGPSGAWTLITAARDRAPDAASLLPAAAAKNRNLFYQGRTPLSAASVLANMRL